MNNNKTYPVAPTTYSSHTEAIKRFTYQQKANKAIREAIMRQFSLDIPKEDIDALADKMQMVDQAQREIRSAIEHLAQDQVSHLSRL